MKRFLLFTLAFALVTAACAPATTAIQEPAAVPTSRSEASLTPAPPAATPVPTATPSPTDTPEPTITPTPDVLPPEPMPVQFQASDGQELEGLYYPAGVENAPVVVLMHWAGGDQHDWVEIAFWLQNRGLGGATPNPDGIPWLDPSWFPPVPEGWSFAVFTFNYRGCDANGCHDFDPAGWLLDSQAALKTASELEGVDPAQVVSAGASIGADGAPDGCFWLNDQEGAGRCLGAFSLSPGDYLIVLYPSAVTNLEGDEPPVPAWCLYAEADVPAKRDCESAEGRLYRAVKYPGGDHGMTLIRPELEPDTLLLLLDFLKLSLGL